MPSRKMTTNLGARIQKEKMKATQRNQVMENTQIRKAADQTSTQTEMRAK